MNELVQRLRTQSSIILANLTAQQKIILIAASVGALALLIIILSWTGGDSFSPLYTDLSQEDAGEILGKLKERQIEYQLQANGRVVMVPDKLVYELRLELAAEGLPGSGGIGYEIFDKQELGVTEFRQQIAYKRALEGELARTIRSIDAVQSASVLIVMPKDRLFRRDEKETTASVQLTLKRNMSPPEMTIEAISHLVSSSVEGLAPENVTITDTKGRILSRQQDPSSSIAASSTQLGFTRQIERDLAAKVTDILEQRVGPGNVIVQITADLNWDQVQKTVQDVDPDRTATLSEEVSEQAASGGGQNSNASERSKIANTITNYEVSKTVEQIISGLGNIKQLSVAVLVNHNKESQPAGDGSIETVPVPRSAEEMQQLEDLAKRAVGFRDERSDQFSIENLPFEGDDEPIEDDFLIPWMDPMRMVEILFTLGTIILAVLVMRSLMSQARERSEELKDEVKELAVAQKRALQEKKRLALVEKEAAVETQELTGKISEINGAVLDYIKKNPVEASSLVKVWLRDAS